MHSRAEQSKAEQSRAEQSKAAQSKAEQINAELTETNYAENTQLKTEIDRETLKQRTHRTAKEQIVNRDATSWTFRLIKITLFPFHCPLW